MFSLDLMLNIAFIGGSIYALFRLGSFIYSIAHDKGWKDSDEQRNPSSYEFDLLKDRIKNLETKRK